MARAGAALQQGKISPDFANRLENVPAQQAVRALVMLDTGRPAPPAGRRRGAEREAAVAAVRGAADAALPDVDRILSLHHGRRLAAHADALGCVAVEATPEGISALAACEHVKAIFEGQPISLIRP
jgi:hypothetical protein